MSRYLIFFIAAWAAGAGCQRASEQTNAIPSRPNILLVMADDWSYPHLSVLGEPQLQTPHIDRLAEAGALFHHAYCAAPSCTPSRASVLTGMYPHQLGMGANVWSLLDTVYPNYATLLERSGYQVGRWQKGWGPGDEKAGGYLRNPAGPAYPDFEDFLAQRDKSRPFCFWMGNHDPHRPYDQGQGELLGMKSAQTRILPFWPDLPEVRKDLTDYFYEVERLDRKVGEAIALLNAQGEWDRTLIVITGDNGMPFPRAKANLYDGGTRAPLVIYGKGFTRPGVFTQELVSLVDLAPTFLEAAGLPAPSQMAGKSLLGLLAGKPGQPARELVFFERERHAFVRAGNLGYPSRGVRTRDFLYIRNFEPNRWPAGDPELVFAVGPYGDCDNSPTKDAILSAQEQAGPVDFFALAFGKRPLEGLYDLRNDPMQLVNVAGTATMAMKRAEMQQALREWMVQTDDPRLTDGADFDRGPYFGPPDPPRK